MYLGDLACSLVSKGGGAGWERGVCAREGRRGERKGTGGKPKGRGWGAMVVGSDGGAGGGWDESAFSSPGGKGGEGREIDGEIAWRGGGLGGVCWILYIGVYIIENKSPELTITFINIALVYQKAQTIQTPYYTVPHYHSFIRPSMPSLSLT